jgi:Tol biopolymer transport system component
MKRITMSIPYFRVLLALFAAAALAAGVLAQVGLAQPVETSAFPGTGGAIVYATSQDSSTTSLLNIFRMDGDGFGKTKLTDSSGLNYAPSWSADGKKIAFTNRVTGQNSEVFQMNADGSEETNLTNEPSARDSGPAWTPDNNKIAFVSDRSGNLDIYLMTLGENGQFLGLTQITTSTASDFVPSVSPDGNKIAFVSDRSGSGNFDIYVMKAAPESSTNRPTRLTKSLAEDSGPDWSPDGTQIAFMSDRTGNFEIFRMKAKPEGKRNRPVNLTNDPSFDAFPSWSPDGKLIAFSRSSTQGDPQDIWRMKAADGTNQVNLTNSPEIDDFDPSWQPLT